MLEKIRLLVRPIFDQCLNAAFSDRLVHMSLTSDDVHDYVCWITVLGEVEARVLEIRLHLALKALVDHPSVPED